MSRSRGRAWLQALVIAIILAFWARVIANNWQQLLAYPWDLSWGWWIAALLLLLAQVFLLATIWWRVLKLVGVLTAWRLAAALWLQTQIARYIPGGIWDMSGRLLLGQQVGIGKRASSASMAMEMALQILSASLFLLFALYLQFRAETAFYLPLAIAVALVSLVVISPPVFTFGVNTLLRLLRRQPLVMHLTYVDVLALFAARLLAHGLLGVGFVFFVQGLTPVPWSQAPLLAAAYVGAWLIGYLALFVPTGIGVREGVLVLLIGDVVGVEVAIAAALGYRLCIAVRDLIAAGLGGWLGRGGWGGFG